jgi:hypothetical protein
MLERLAAKPHFNYTIDRFLVFAVSEWTSNRFGVLQAIREARLGPTVVVRSSVRGEDEDSSLLPGLFKSVLEVSTDEDAALGDAVDNVVASYSKHDWGPNVAEQNEIIVQSQVRDPVFSGVAHIVQGDAYCLVDYDDRTQRTDGVTAGLDCKSAEVILNTSIALPRPWESLREALVEVLTVAEIEEAIVEFAVTEGPVVHVFQARKYSGAKGKSQLSTDAVDILGKSRVEVETKGGLWSDMTDWNPAELLGPRPEPLAVSLYTGLISSSAWLDGRSSLGYRVVHPRQLTSEFAGKPYVDVPLSFLSFTPHALSVNLATKLVDDRLAMLRGAPELHDKVETEVLFTTADVAMPLRTQALLERGFSHDEVGEIEEALRVLTNSLVLDEPLWAKLDLDTASLLTSSKRTISNSPQAVAAQITESITSCRVYGVIPFARQARLAFAARDLFANLQRNGSIDAKWYSAWWAGLRTVVNDVVAAVEALAGGRISKPEFDRDYGHLRAHSFDICSPRYDTIPDLPIRVDSPGKPSTPRACDMPQDVANSINAAFRTAGLSFGVDTFVAFAQRSFQLRERLKFELSRTLSDVLEMTAYLGSLLSLSREDMAFTTIDDIRDIAFTDLSAGEIRQRVEGRRRSWSACTELRLPDLLTGPDDLVVVPRLPGEPNFVTSATTEGIVVIIPADWFRSMASLAGAIAVIEAADPGFDWIFACGIAGLVTRYGGATSHMAIRCEQLQIPAAIGCGERLYREILASERVRLDCGGRRLTPIVNTGAGPSTPSRI